ncbi:AAA family ATPase [Desulfohalovibrio reitneri]|uniref:cytidylate kinase-like family protein n=1 Tax=Desulfohalovibrio reitneri TaxID=1307759 RepID=UPI0004A6FB34|nr:cytidylate kinase-like family protein [Desulfohalovibrio reitneri]
MSIISISRDSYSHGQEIARRVSEALGFDNVAREVILEAAQKFDVPEKRIESALSENPRGLRALFSNKDRHLAFFKAAFFERMRSGGVVYHGLAGHAFLQDVPGALKVRLVASMDDRVREEMRREGLTEETARRRLEKLDEARREWSMAIYGVDNHDVNFYDLVINLSSMSVDEAVETIVDLAGHKAFEETGETFRTLEDKALAARAEAEVLRSFDKVRARCEEGHCYISVEAPLLAEETVARKVRAIAMNVEGVREVTAGVHMGDSSLAA